MRLGALLAGGLAVSIFAALPLAGQATSDSTKLRLARELIHISGADSAALRGIEMMIGMQRNTNASVPPAFWDEFLKRARQDLPQLIDSLAPIYARRFSTPELTQLKAFYATPLGRRMVAEQAKLQQESTVAGARWGGLIGAKVGAEFMQRGAPKAP